MAIKIFGRLRKTVMRVTYTLYLYTEYGHSVLHTYLYNTVCKKHSNVVQQTFRYILQGFRIQYQYHPLPASEIKWKVMKVLD